MPEQHALTHTPESPDDELKRPRERVAEQAAIIEGQTATIEQMHERISRSHHHVRGANPAGASPVDNRVGAASSAPWSRPPISA